MNLLPVILSTPESKSIEMTLRFPDLPHVGHRIRVGETSYTVVDIEWLQNSEGVFCPWISASSAT